MVSLDKFVPDIYVGSIYKINYSKLKEKGIKCLLFDLDNTLASVNEKKPNDRLISFIDDLKKDFKIIIISNLPKNHVEPFKIGLEVDSCAFALKPKKDKYEKILETYSYSSNEVAAIGDQLVTDIYGANNMELLSILVNPISVHDRFTTRVNRFLERRIENRLRKKNLFLRGRYYGQKV